MEFNDKYHKRRGRTPLNPPDKRIYTVSARLNAEELALLDSKCGAMKRGEWMRCASLDSFRPVVPEPNQEKWAELARSASNLNHIAKHLNANNQALNVKELDEVRDALIEFRALIIGITEEMSE
jgi:hypothetical protein